GIRDFHVTGVQTCALPILPRSRERAGVAVREHGAALGHERSTVATYSEALGEIVGHVPLCGATKNLAQLEGRCARWCVVERCPQDRKSVVYGGRVGLGGAR